MKIPTGRIKNIGNALLVALVLCGILCVSITGYLSVAEQQYFLSMRSQAWNMAITVVEAGIEEGLEHCNVNGTTGNYGVDGWTQNGIWWTHNTTLPSGDGYTVSLTFTNIYTPTIIAKANMQAPTLFTKGYSPFLFAAGGINVNGSSESTFVTRAVQVHTIRSALLIKAMVAKHTINMNGNGITTDSYDSGNMLLSNYGQYDPNHVGDKGDIASNDTITNAISGGNANIFGHVQTGPNGGAGINQGEIGSHSYQASHPNGSIEPGWYSHDSNFTFPDTPLPYNSGLPLGAGTNVVTTTYNINSNFVGSASSPPNPPPWSGVVTGITSWATLSTIPSPIPQGFRTNTTSTSSFTYPADGTYTGNVTTNSGANTNNAPYPMPGSYVGGIQTNYLNQVQVKNSGSRPADGTYVPGTLTQKSNGNWQYTAFSGMNYNYTLVGGFSYNLITGYSYPIYNYNYATYQTNTVYQTNYYDHVISSGDYYYDGTLSGNTIVVGQARLVLPNGLNMSGHDSITIANGGSLVTYVGGSTLSLSGNSSGNISDGGVINQGYPANFKVFASSTVTNVAFNGNGEFSGVLVAPYANVTMNGGGSANNDFMGALLVNSVVMNGHFNFHYDEALARDPTWGRLLITSWDEISPHL
jgi:hypothetical protein